MKKVLLTGISLSLMIFTLNAQSFESSEKEKMQKINFAQAIFRKKLQKKCGYTAGYWAQQHTLIEWKFITASGDFKHEFAAMCPRGAEVLKEKWIEPLYLFAKEYAKDTDQRPKC